MLKHFLYVFCAEARDSLLKRGYKLLQGDDRQKIWIFANKDDVPFSDENYAFILSDTLTL